MAVHFFSEVLECWVRIAGMSERPTFSILHASARPEGWRAAYDAWMTTAGWPADVEYILSIPEGQREAFAPPGMVKVVETPSGAGTVAAWNAAARASMGRVLVVAADDLFPCAAWDVALYLALGASDRNSELDRPRVLHVDCRDPWPHIITHPILTRAYYEMPGRGGHPNGELFYPEYLSVGSDDDFGLCAWRDRVVIEAPQIKFEHRHPAVGSTDMDAVYQFSNRAEAWRRKDKVLGQRLAGMFGLGQAPKRTIAVITPGADFPARWASDWDILYAYLLSRYQVRRVFAESNNIYQVREMAVRTYQQMGPADYVLWLDSDNPPTIDAFRWLMAAVEAAETNTDPALPPVDIIGAWYRYSHPSDLRTFIAAGLKGYGERAGQLSEADVLAAKERNELIENVEYIGFGMLLMRGPVVDALGPEGFYPAYPPDSKRYLTDDVSWCYRARERGYRIYLHPMAFVEHLKRFPVPAQSGDFKQSASGPESEN